MASITAQTAHSTNASECSATLCQSESRSGKKTASPVAIEAKSFEFAYPPSEDPQTACASIGPLDWRVPQGAFQLLVGAIGSGKTTLLRNCKPSIAPHGECAGELAVFGQLAIVCDTVWHEVAFGLENLGTLQDVMRRRVAEVAHFFGIEPWFRRQVSELSGGQRQIVTLASALALRPSLLLLDEPTKGLDPQTKCQVAKAIQEQARTGVTVVMATHDLPFAALVADEATMLFDGESAATQSVPEFFADNLFYRPTCDSFAKQWSESGAGR